MPDIDVEKLKRWAPLSAAAVLGLAAAGTGWILVASADDGGDAGPRTRLERLVVASRPLPAGHEIAPDDLTFINVEAGALPATAFTDASALLGESGENGPIQPRVITIPVAAGQPIMAENLAAEQTPGGVAALVKPGMRAIVVEADRDNGLAHLIEPGAFLDILATVSDGDDTVARTIAQNVPVLAVGGRLRDGTGPGDGDEAYENPEDRGRHVTLMVTPEQAARIDLAIASGRPRLVLRGGGDSDLSKFEGLTLAQLLGRDDDATNAWPVAPGGDAWNDPWEAPVARDPDADLVPDVVGRDATPQAATPPTGSAGVSTEPADGAGTVPLAPGQGEAKTASPDTERAQPPARRRPRVVEIIRGGVSSKEIVPEAKPSAPGQDD